LSGKPTVHKPVSAGTSAPQPFPFNVTGLGAAGHSAGGAGSAAGWASTRGLRSLRQGRAPGAAGVDVRAGTGREGAAVAEVRGAASAFGEAELPGQDSPSAPASPPGHRARPRGRAQSITGSQARGTHAHAAAQPRISAPG